MSFQVCLSPLLQQRVPEVAREFFMWIRKLLQSFPFLRAELTGRVSVSLSVWAAGLLSFHLAPSNVMFLSLPYFGGVISINRAGSFWKRAQGLGTSVLW